MHEIRSIGVLSAAKIIGVIYFIIGEILAFLFALGAAAHGHPGRGIAAIALLGVIQGVIGFVVSAVSCWFYNQIAARIGGIQVEVTQFGS